MGKFTEWISHAWNAFTSKGDQYSANELQGGSYINPGRFRMARGSERSILNAALNRIALDCASVKIRHVRLDDNERMVEVLKGTINERFKVEANLDQTGRAMLQQMYLDMMDKGVVAVVPVDTDFNPKNTEAYKIFQIRTGTIKEWYPKHVRVDLYNQDTGRHEEVTVEKKWTAIIENPMYPVMNDTNSTFQRLMRKLSILDIVDEQSGSGKLDMIIQLPYTIKSEARRAEARRRRDDLEDQIKNSKLGIAYTDATEKIIQLNKSLENNLLKQIEYLTNLFYSQLGITPEIMNGTANEEAMNNYYNRTIEPFVAASAEEFHRKFLTKTARTQGQAIVFFRDPFKLLPVNSIAEIGDKFTRNEIMTANEIRQILGMKPSGDPKSDELRNANMPIQDQIDPNLQQTPLEEELNQNDAQLAKLEQDLSHSGVLMHYASKYYDPVKAHEYYERTKQLKGTKAKTITLNDEGKAIAKNVKENLTKEKNTRISNIRSNTKNINDQRSTELKRKINSITAYLSQLSPERKEQERKRLLETVKNLRKENAQARMDIQSNTNRSIGKLKEDYGNKYQTEYERIAKEYPGGGKGGSSPNRYKKRFWVNR